MVTKGISIQKQILKNIFNPKKKEALGILREAAKYYLADFAKKNLEEMGGSPPPTPLNGKSKFSQMLMVRAESADPPAPPLSST